MSTDKPSAQREEAPTRDALVRRGIVPRPEFVTCDGCGMPSSCKAARHCGKKATHGNQPTGDWPFNALAAARRTAIEKIDADAAGWKQRALDALYKLPSGSDITELLGLINNVVAVRA